MSEFLLVDTSLNSSLLARLRLGDQVEIIEQFQESNQVRTSKSLDLLSQSFLQSGWQPNGIIVAHGPGSFTGVRLGLSYSYGLWFGWNQEPLCVGYSSLQSIVKVWKPDSQRRALFFPATQEHGYVVYLSDGKMVQAVIDFKEGLKVKQDLFDKTWQNQFSDYECLVWGSWKKMQEHLESYHSKITILDNETADSLRMLYWQKTLPDLWPNAFEDILPTPIYLRRSAPEERLSSQPKTRPRGGHGQ